MNDNHYKNIATSLSKIAKQLEPIHKTYDSSVIMSALTPLNQMTQAFNDALKNTPMRTTIRIMQDSIDTAQFLETCQKISDAWKAIDSAKLVAISKVSADLMSCAKAIDSPHNNMDDYVELPREIAKINNEVIVVPDELCIPIGSKRVRMKTEIFLALLSLLIPLFMQIPGTINRLNTLLGISDVIEEELSESQSDTYIDNNVTINFIDSVDCTHSRFPPSR